MNGAWLAAHDLQPHALDRAAVAALLPQRTPLLLVDQVWAVGAPGRARPAVAAALHLTGDEPVLAGHFPGRPVWPGSYTIEGLAQACVLAGALFAGGAGPPAVLLAAVKVKLLGLVVPPARLDYFAEQIAVVDDVVRFSVQASVAERVVAAGSLDVVVSPGAR